MSATRKRVEQLKLQKKLREGGKLFFMPWFYHFPRLSEHVPGLIKGQLTKILSPTGVGKSKLARYLSVIIPYELKLKYGLKYKTLFFSLEESKEDFIDNMIIMLLKMRHNIEIDILTLNSYFKAPLDDKVLEKIMEISDEVDEILKDVEIIDNIKNPTGIYSYVKEFSNRHGKHYSKKVQFDTGEAEIYSHYEQYDPELFITVVVDHIGLLQTEYDSLKGKKLSAHEALAKWSTDYCVGQVCKHLKYCVLNVQQVGMSSDDVTHFKAGKLEPSISDAGKNKEIIQDDHLVVSLYAPSRHEQSTHDGYNVKIMQDKYRSMKVLKNRKGKSYIKVGLYFEGATGRFSELPPPTEINYDDY